MCTAICLATKDTYFGRNLDLDCSYGEEVCVLPRCLPLSFRQKTPLATHYAMIGMATVVGGTALLYDAANEHGLAMAGLNFPGNAYYPEKVEGKDNIAPFEFIPWILGQCKTVAEARVFLSRINLVNISFAPTLPLSPLHWILSDSTESIVIESMQDGLHIHENPVGVLTNNPPFPYHLFNLNNYRGLGVTNGENTFLPEQPLVEYCQGLGALGLPGDPSSMSRFVRAVFGASHSVSGEEEQTSVNQFFHLLTSVEMPRGTCRTPAGVWDVTVYSSCINTTRGLYYYTTYENRRIRCVDMHRVDLEGDTLFRYPLHAASEIAYDN